MSPFTFKAILRQKKYYGNSNIYIASCKNLIFKKSSQWNQNPSRYYNSLTNLEFQHKPKISSFQNPHIKIDLLLLPRGQNPLSYHTLWWIYTQYPRQGKQTNKLLALPGTQQVRCKWLWVQILNKFIRTYLVDCHPSFTSIFVCVLV